MNTAVSAVPSASTLRIPPLPERLRTIVGCLRTLAKDPGRLDVVLVLTQTVNLPALGRALDRVAASEEGRALLAERPRIDRATVDLEALARLPDGTLGREYARFLADNGITPEPFETLPDVGDERAAYIMLRLRQSHDLWHVMTGYAPDVRGELLLQAFTYAQTGAPSALLICVFGWLRYGRLSVRLVRELLRAHRRGLASGAFPTFRWEDHWETPVADLVRRFGVPAVRA